MQQQINWEKTLHTLQSCIAGYIGSILGLIWVGGYISTVGEGNNRGAGD